MKDYAFAFFEERENALDAMNNLNGYEIGGACMEITLAKPLMDKKKRDEMLRKREMRTQALIGQKTGNFGPQNGRNMRGGFRDQGPRWGPPGPYGGGYDYYGGGCDYQGGYGDPYYGEEYGYYDYSPAPRGSRGGASSGYRGGMPPSQSRGAPFGRGGPMMGPGYGRPMPMMGGFGMKGGRGMPPRGSHRGAGDYGFR